MFKRALRGLRRRLPDRHDAGFLAGGALLAAAAFTIGVTIGLAAAGVLVLVGTYVDARYGEPKPGADA